MTTKDVGRDSSGSVMNRAVSTMPSPARGAASVLVAPPPPQPAAATDTRTRIASIDAFRGFVMFLMLAEVMRLFTLQRAYPASRFWSIVAFNTTHVPWQGCSLHDL